MRDRRRASLGAGLIVLSVWLTAVLLGGSAQAQTSPGIPLPTPAGSTWTVLQGYNTPSHTGVDPHAIDLVRVDADSSGTPILAPVDGLIAFRSADCIAIRDGSGLYILLCHVWPTANLSLGDRVVRGDEIAIVKPPGPDEFWRAHIHLAVHRTLIRNSVADTIPLSGRYALEGRDLVDTTDSDAYSGFSFVSSNGGLSLSGVTFPPGLTHLVWQGETVTPGEGFQPLIGDLEVVYAWNPQTRRYTVYRPVGPAFLTTLNAVHAGDLLWLRMRVASVWDPTANSSPGSQILFSIR